jgi:hypothetical protein
MDISRALRRLVARRLVSDCPSETMRYRALEGAYSEHLPMRRSISLSAYWNACTQA